MRVVLATLCLNEEEWLPRLYEQHKGWDDLVGWVFVEATDRRYAAANPEAVTPGGLSTDATTSILRSLVERDPRVRYVAHGFTGGADPAQGKCEARSRYLEVADEFEPDAVIVIDADEAYTFAHQRLINAWLEAGPSASRALLLQQRHLWLPPSLQAAAGTWWTPYEHDPPFSLEVIGGYWAIPHCRVYRWSKGLRYYEDHNHPQTAGGQMLAGPRVMHDLRDHSSAPECVHLGFASSLAARAAKHRYYVARGEGAGDGRGSYVSCRTAWETWTPGSELPQGAQVVPYLGPVPERYETTAAADLDSIDEILKETGG